MQILYCDDCGIRLDDVEADDNTKVYCVQCAPKHAAEIKSATQLRATAKRESIRGRSTKAPNLHPSNSAIPRAASARVRTHSTGVAAADAAVLDTAMAPDSAALPAWKAWIANNRPIAIGAAGVLSVVLSVVCWMLFGGRRGATPADNAKVVEVVKQPNSADGSGTKTGGDKAVQNPITQSVDAAKPETPVETKTFNAVFEVAKERLDTLKTNIAAGKLSNSEARKQLQWFMGSQLKNTPMQTEATALLEKVKEQLHNSDDATGAVPGVQVRVGFDKAVELFDTDFKTAALKRVPVIDFASSAALKKAFGRDQELALKFTGFIEVPKDGVYTFYLSSDDGSALYFDNDKLIYHPGAHALSERDGAVSLKAGKHRFRLEYFQGIGDAGLKFSWSGPGMMKQIVPATALSSLPSAVK